VIEAGALVVDSVLMEGCHVAADAKVAGSVLGPHAIVGRAPTASDLCIGSTCRGRLRTLVDGDE